MADVLAVAVVVVPGVVVLLRDEPHVWPNMVAVGVAATVVYLRRRWPLPLLGIAVGNTFVVYWMTGEQTPAIVAVVVMLYTVAAIHRTRDAWLAGAVAVLVLGAGGQVFLDDSLWGPGMLALIPWSALAVGAGIAQRNRSEYVAAIEDRMRWAEETREEEAKRRVAQDRLRVARDLHDLVAHHMAVINFQAAAAAQLVFSDADAAAVSLELVRSSAATVIDEMGAVLRVLRSDEDDPLEPAPTLRDIDSLVESFTTAGLRVERVQEGAMRQIPEAVQLAAYRIVQESLTNAQKHGTGEARFRLVSTSNALEIEISNPVPGGSSQSTAGHGYGTVGIQERVAAASGSADIGPVDGGLYMVRALIPLSPQGGT